jgi:hypothetical protein
MGIPSVGVTIDAIERSYWMTGKGVPFLVKPPEFNLQQTNVFAGKINLNLAIAPITTYGAVASEPSAQNNWNVQDFNTGETWYKNIPTFVGGVANSMIETITKHNLNRILLISPDKKYLTVNGNPLYIQDQTSQNGLGYLFANTKLFHPDRSDEDCLAFAAIAYYRPDPINRPWAGNPFFYATRKGPTYGTYWEVIDQAKLAGKKTADDIVKQVSAWADETNHEMAQHQIDMAHFRQNVFLFSSAGLMAIMGLTAVFFAPAAIAAPVAVAPAQSAAPVTVSFLEGPGVATAVTAGGPSLLSKAISAGGDALNAAIPAAIGKLGSQLQDAIAPKVETSKPIANTTEQTPNSGTGLIAVLAAIGVALLFFI